MTSHFPAARWSTSLKAASALGTLVVLAVAWAAGRVAPELGPARGYMTGVSMVVLAVPAGALLFIVRGFGIDSGQLLVERLLWTTRVPLDGLSRLWLDPAALRGSWRVFGNGGLYSITGLYWSRRLGKYRAFVTDPRRAVVMALPRRAVVISPEDPERFIEQARMFRRL